MTRASTIAAVCAAITLSACSGSPDAGGRAASAPVGGTDVPTTPMARARYDDLRWQHVSGWSRMPIDLPDYTTVPALLSRDQMSTRVLIPGNASTTLWIAELDCGSGRLDLKEARMIDAGGGEMAAPALRPSFPIPAEAVRRACATKPELVGSPSQVVGKMGRPQSTTMMRTERVPLGTPRGERPR